MELTNPEIMLIRALINHDAVYEELPFTRRDRERMARLEKKLEDEEDRRHKARIYISDL